MSGIVGWVKKHPYLSITGAVLVTGAALYGYNEVQRT